MRLRGLARERETPIFSGESAWYGLDPIHPRRAAAGEIWRRMLGALIELDAAPTTVAVGAARAQRLRRLPPASWSQFGYARCAAQPCARLADGTTIAVY
jgi:sugar phosphate isomerase/epimerase